MYLVTNLKPSSHSRQQQALGSLWHEIGPTGVRPAAALSVGDRPGEATQRQMLLQPALPPINLSCTRFTSWLPFSRPERMHLR